MTNLDYIRQLPGCKGFDCDTGACHNDIGLDKDCCGDCEACENAEATIGGKPAPYLLPCPVKPGVKVWVGVEDEVFLFTVFSVTIYKKGWEATAYHKNQYGIKIGEEAWGTWVFRTKEEAEQKLKEMMNDGK